MVGPEDIEQPVAPPPAAVESAPEAARAPKGSSQEGSPNNSSRRHKWIVMGSMATVVVLMGVVIVVVLVVTQSSSGGDDNTPTEIMGENVPPDDTPITTTNSTTSGEDPSTTYPTGDDGTSTTTAWKMSDIGLVGTQSITYTIDIQPVSVDDSCDTTASTGVLSEPVPLTATCPQGAVTPLKGPCRVESDGRTVSCFHEMASSSTTTTQVTCYAPETTSPASSPQDLALTVSVPESTNQQYQCTQQIDFASGFNGHHWTRTYYGGWVANRVVLKSVLFGSPVCASSSTTSFFLADRTSPTGSCQTSFFRGFSGGWPIESGSTSCYASPKSVQVTADLLLEAMVDTEQGTIRSEQCIMTPMVLDIATGEACTYNVECDSNVCIDGICQTGPLADKELGCDDDMDCVSQACAPLSLLDPSSTNNSEELLLGCCASGASRRMSDGSRVCTEQPTDALCANDDELCASGVCLFDHCQEGRLDPFYYCQRGNHCLSGGCALSVSDETLCCPTGDTVTVEDKTYCANLEVDYLCQHDQVCQNGACGLGSYDPENAERFCCPSGATVRVLGPDLDWDDYCTQLEAGTFCGSDDMCAPGADGGEGACAHATYEADASVVCCSSGTKTNAYEADHYPWRADYCADMPPGAVCGSNEMCKSSVCVDGICQDSFQNDLERCDDSGDCASGGGCGVGFYSVTADRVCCSGGAPTMSLNKPDSAYSDDYCTNLPEQTLCGSDDMCDPAEGGTSACARGSYEAGEAPICCPTGVKVELYEADHYPWRAEYCAALGPGAKCGDNAMCESDLCLNGLCQ